MVDQDTDAALELLNEPAIMVSAHGAMKFDHSGYRKMAEQGDMVVSAFEHGDVEVVFPNKTTAVLSYRVKQTIAPRRSDSAGKIMTQEMHDSSTWIDVGNSWKCVMHTETEAAARQANH